MKTNRNVNRALSLLLTLLLLAGLLPLNVWADSPAPILPDPHGMDENQPAATNEGEDYYFWRGIYTPGEGSGVVSVYREDAGASMGRTEVNTGDRLSVDDVLLIHVQPGPYSTVSDAGVHLYDDHGIGIDVSSDSNLPALTQTETAGEYRFENSRVQEAHKTCDKAVVVTFGSTGEGHSLQTVKTNGGELTCNMWVAGGAGIKRAKSGDTIIVNVMPNDGFALKGLYLLGMDDPLPTTVPAITSDFADYSFGSNNYSCTMPDYDAKIYAVFAPPEARHVTINGGTGSGEYVAAASVRIAADAPEEGKRFKEWSGAENLAFIEGTSAADADAVFQMPFARDVTLTAMYEEEATYDGVYAVTVGASVNGATTSGSGSYAVGENVRIKAEPSPFHAGPNKFFKKWTGTEGLTFVEGSMYDNEAVFVMPAHDVTLTATFGLFEVTFTVDPPEGGNMYVYSPSSETRYERNTALEIRVNTAGDFIFNKLYVNGTEVNATKVSEDNPNNNPRRSYSFTLTDDTEIKATFYPNLTHESEVRWLNGDGSVLYRATYQASINPMPSWESSYGTPVKAASNACTYTFREWDEGTTEGYVTTFRPLFDAQYFLWIGGEQVTSENLSGDGWEFTPATDETPHELALTDANITGAPMPGSETDTAAIYSKIDDLELTLTGANTVTGADVQTYSVGYDGSYGIVTASLTVTGAGSLTVTGAEGDISAGIVVCSGGSLTVSGGTVTAVGGPAKNRSSGIFLRVTGDDTLASMTVSGGTVTAIGGPANSASTDSYGIYSDSVEMNGSEWTIGCELTVTGGTLTATGCMDGASDELPVYSKGIVVGRLRVENGTVTATGGPAQFRSDGIELIETNSATAVMTVSGGTVTATGSTAEKYSRGIVLNNTGTDTVALAVSGGTVTATGGTISGTGNKDESSGIHTYSGLGNVNVSGGTVTASGATRAFRTKQISLTDYSPAPDVTVKTDLSEENAAEWDHVTDLSAYPYVKIEPHRYNLWVGGEQVTSENLSGDGWEFTPATDETPHALALTNANITGAPIPGSETDTAAIYSGINDLELTLTGANTVTGVDAPTGCSFGIYATGSLTVTGNGELTVTGGKASQNASNFANRNCSGTCGVFVRSLVMRGGVLNATGGIAEADSGKRAETYGVYLPWEGGRLIVEDGVLNAAGGTAGDNGWSIGAAIAGANAELTVTGGVLNAAGGTVGYNGWSIGAATAGENAELTVTGGVLNAAGGAAGAAGRSVGIEGVSATITGGTVTAVGVTRALSDSPQFSDYIPSPYIAVNRQASALGARRWDWESDLGGQSPIYCYVRIEPHRYNLWVGGVQVTEENRNDVLEDGDEENGISPTVVFTPATEEGTAKLTLTDASIAGMDSVEPTEEYYEARITGIYALEDLEIELAGENSVEGRRMAIYAEENLTFTGSGSLTAAAVGQEAVSVGIHVGRALTVGFACEVIARGGDGTEELAIFWSKGIECGDLTVDGIVEAYGGRSVRNGGSDEAYTCGIDVGANRGRYIDGDGLVYIPFGGSVTAVGGDCQGAYDPSYGIRAVSVDLEGGVLSAGGGSVYRGPEPGRKDSYGVYLTSDDIDDTILYIYGTMEFWGYGAPLNKMPKFVGVPAGMLDFYVNETASAEGAHQPDDHTDYGPFYESIDSENFVWIFSQYFTYDMYDSHDSTDGTLSSKYRYLRIEEAVEYDVWVSSWFVTERNKTDVLNDGGSVSFTPATATAPAVLTLNNANITGSREYIGSWTGFSGPVVGSLLSDLVLVLIGENTITAGYYPDMTGVGIYSKGNLTIRGEEGSALRIVTPGGEGSAGSVGICADPNDSYTLTVESGSITVESGESARSYAVVAHAMTVSGGSITASGCTQAFYVNPNLTGYSPAPAVRAGMSADGSDAATVSDAAELTGYKYVAIYPTPDAQVFGHSLTLNGEIGVNTYMLFSDAILADAENYQVEFWHERTMSFCQKVSAVEQPKSLKSGGETYAGYGFSVTCVAKDMGKVFTMKIKNLRTNQYINFYNSDRSIVDGTVGLDYCVNDYLLDRIANSSDPDMVQLAKDMWAYGVYANYYFTLKEGGTTDPLPEIPWGFRTLTAEDLSQYARYIVSDITHFTYRGATLVLEEDTSFRLYFQSDNMSKLTIKIGNTELPIQSGNGMYYVEVKNIAAKALDEMYDFTISNGTDTTTVRHGALGYAHWALTSSGNESLQYVMMSLYHYNQAAKRYFPNTN